MRSDLIQAKESVQLTSDSRLYIIVSELLTYSAVFARSIPIYCNNSEPDLINRFQSNYGWATENAVNSGVSSFRGVVCW